MNDKDIHKHFKTHFQGYINKLAEMKSKSFLKLTIQKSGREYPNYIERKENDDEVGGTKDLCKDGENNNISDNRNYNITNNIPNNNPKNPNSTKNQQYKKSITNTVLLDIKEEELINKERIITNDSKQKEIIFDKKSLARGIDGTILENNFTNTNKPPEKQESNPDNNKEQVQHNKNKDKEFRSKTQLQYINNPIKGKDGKIKKNLLKILIEDEICLELNQ